MVKKVYSVFDSKAGSYLDPFFMNTRGEALRAVSTSVNQPNNILSAHPADYTLFELGEYDLSSGRFTQSEAHVNLGCVIEFKEK